jgi:hypothetical protein
MTAKTALKNESAAPGRTDSLGASLEYLRRIFLNRVFVSH